MASLASPPTFVHLANPGEFDLAINSNKKMKTVLVVASFIGNLDETVTCKALLPLILRRGTRKFPDMLSLNRYLEGLYGASLTGYVQKVGEWHLLRFRLELVNERFLPGEKGLLRAGLEFLREVLWEPLEVEGGFHPEFLDGEKNNLKLSIESLLDNKSAYAEQRLIEEMCREEPFRLYEQGRVADIPGIEPRSLLELHRRVVREYPFHLYIAGDFDAEAMQALALEVFSPGAAPRTGGLTPNPIPGPIPVRGVREVEERMVVNQAKLFLGFRHGITYAHPGYEALLLMNGVLGAFAHSKLFQNVREKAHLAYSIHSSVERTKGLLFIGSGIAPENHKKAHEIILDQVRSLKAGEITDDEMGATVSTILNSNEMLEDNLAALADVDLVWRLHGRELDLLAFRKRIQQVTKEEVVEVARRLEHDTTYLLTA